MNEKIYKILQSMCYTPWKNQKEYRRSLLGIYHNGGKLIASDGRMLAAVIETYPPAMEGRIYQKGCEIEENYPSYLGVFPSTLTPCEVDVTDLKKILTTIPLKQDSVNTFLRIGRANLELFRIKKILAVFKAVNETPVVLQYVASKKKVFTVFQSEKAMVLIVSGPLLRAFKHYEYTISQATKRA